MANKIKCTCGHSWDKSDSSKKDAYICHICGKDNTMKDGGWLDKYDVPEAQNGIEGTMGGLTDKGFNYNGAWGGPSMQDGGNLMPAMAGANQTVPMAQLGDSVKPITMQLAMGGSIPGAVGFTYARTAGAAPANGPYAKKTKASAQNGMEMKYYQQGLDFKPKTISQDGSEIPIDPMGYWNPENVGGPVIIPSNIITMKDVDQPLLGISDTGDVQMMYPGEDYEFDGETVTEYPVAQNGGDYDKKYPPIYLSDPKDPRIGYYSEKGNKYLYKKPAAKESQLPTLYVDNPRDPRLRAYNDSLSAYNIDKAWEKFIRTVPDMKYTAEEIDKLSDKYRMPLTKSSLRNLAVIDKNGIRKTDYTRDVLVNDNQRRSYYSPVYNKPKQRVEYRKPQPKKQEPVKKTEQPKPIERKQNVYEGSPVYSPGAGSGLRSALIGFANQKGDITYIKPEDYERFAVPKYGKEYIESKKKQRNGGVNKADEYPIEKLDQSLNFTNYNKPTKGGWLDKYK